ncbi:MAG: hypothetical protein ACFFG0_34160 [Candidatus Thorarchaeota archaeon]
MEKILIGISGSRTKKHPNKMELDHLIYQQLKAIVLVCDKARVTFVSGGAKSGADEQIRLVCQDLGYEYDGDTYKPDFSNGYAVWKFFDRNKRMARDITTGYCFWDGKSKGTKHFIDYMNKLISKGERKFLVIISWDSLLVKSQRKLTVTNLLNP